MSTSSWHILGAGSIGCLWAAHFCQQGIKPCVLLRPERYERIGSREVNLSITWLDGSIDTFPVEIASVSELQAPVQNLLVCTKATDALRAIEPLSPWLTNDSNILLLQNGMGSQQEITRQFSNSRIWTGSTTDGAWLKEPFNVCHAGRGMTWLGSLNPDIANSDHPFIQSFQNFPLSVEYCENIEEKLWEKLAVNCAINGLTALYDCRNGELVEDSKIASRLALLVEEVIQVQTAAGQRTNPALLEVVQQVCRATGANYSSTCMDVRWGRKTELAYINGYLMDLAQSRGIQLPENQQLMSELAAKGVLW